MPQQYTYHNAQHGRAEQTPPQQTYQNRYQRNANTTLDKLYGAGPFIIALVSFLIALSSLIALQGVDIIAGRFSSGYFTKIEYGWYYSLATTGIVLATTGSALYAWREEWHPLLLGGLLIVALVPIGIDIYFDMLAVDVIKYGHLIDPAIQFVGNPIEMRAYQLFRILTGFLSFIGEPLAAASVILFPVIKELIKGVVS